MSNGLMEFNFVAGGTIAAGQLVAFTTGGNLERLAVAGTTSNLAKVFGIALKPAVAGEAITVAKMQAGNIVNILAGGSISAGDVIAVGSAGLVASASGNYPLNLVAVEAGSAGDLIPALVTYAVPAAANT